MTAIRPAVSGARLTPNMPSRRAFPRRKARGSARYCPSGRLFASWKAAKPVDICEDGIGLVVREPLAAGARVDVELDPPGNQRGLAAMAEVRWAAPLADGSYRVGLRWERRIAFAEMQKFV